MNENKWTAFYLDGINATSIENPVTHWQPLPSPPNHNNKYEQNHER